MNPLEEKRRIKPTIQLFNIDGGHFTIEFSAAAFREFAACLEADRRCNWPQTASAFLQIAEHCGNYIPKAKDGFAHHVFRVGKEDSPVIYVHIFKAYITEPFDYIHLGELLTILANLLDADEYGILKNEDDPHGEFVFRFWWD